MEGNFNIKTKFVRSSEKKVNYFLGDEDEFWKN